jgi:hypothetical protein
LRGRLSGEFKILTLVGGRKNVCKFSNLKKIYHVSRHPRNDVKRQRVDETNEDDEKMDRLEEGAFTLTLWRLLNKQIDSSKTIFSGQA